MAVSGMLIVSAAYAKYTTVTLSKDSKKAAELGYSITLTPNNQRSGLAGTTTFWIRVPKKARLQPLSRAILIIKDREKLACRIPLELSTAKSGEVSCHFQLTPETAKRCILVLVPKYDLPAGAIYEVELASYLPKN